MIARIEMDQGVKGCVFNRGRECGALSRFMCRNGTPCGLYKTEKDVERSEQETIKRLCSLSEEKQTEIADRLFNGRKPWKGEGPWDTHAGY